MSKLFEKDVIVIDCRSTKQKVEDLKWKAKDKLHSAGEWCNRNKEWLYFIVPIAVPMATSMIKGSIRKRNLNKEEKLKEEYCYDRSLGHYWALKRKLSNKEWLEIEGRRKNGERLADILSDMRVLK